MAVGYKGFYQKLPKLPPGIMFEGSGVKFQLLFVYIELWPPATQGL